jgi:molybdopterin synthase sulfur carrier subunit
MVRVLLFGRLRDLADWRERAFDPVPGRLSALKAMIAAEDPGLAAALEGPGVRAAVNRELALGDCDLAPGAEVAFLPPMSGG